ncbi:MAG: hypothetical protein HY832_02895 [Candidatus Aenigmarchaeota archaeon]|nr:hypothetical protein [Candidatus Aenigmarchaeota archaeon]
MKEHSRNTFIPFRKMNSQQKSGVQQNTSFIYNDITYYGVLSGLTQRNGTSLPVYDWYDKKRFLVSTELQGDINMAYNGFNPQKYHEPKENKSK